MARSKIEIHYPIKMPNSFRMPQSIIPDWALEENQRPETKNTRERTFHITKDDIYDMCNFVIGDGINNKDIHFRIKQDIKFEKNINIYQIWENFQELEEKVAIQKHPNTFIFDKKICVFGIDFFLVYRPTTVTHTENFGYYRYEPDTYTTLDFINYDYSEQFKNILLDNHPRDYIQKLINYNFAQRADKKRIATLEYNKKQEESNLKKCLDEKSLIERRISELRKNLEDINNELAELSKTSTTIDNTTTNNSTTDDKTTKNV